MRDDPVSLHAGLPGTRCTPPATPLSSRLLAASPGHGPPRFRPSPPSLFSFLRRAHEHHRDLPRSTTRAPQPARQHPQWKIPPPRPHQRVQLKFRAVHAPPHALQALAAAKRAPRLHLPARVADLPQRLQHTPEPRTESRQEQYGNASVRSRPAIVRKQAP